MADIREDTIRVLGLRLPVRECGPENAEEAVVFLHGQPGSSRDWQRMLHRVGEFARAVAFDLPGLGKAEKPVDWDYGIGMYGTAVAGALDALRIRRAHLVMHDLGGGAGLMWAAAHPEAFRSAVIMSTGVLIDYQWHWFARLQRAPVIAELMARMTTRRTFKQVMRRLNPNLPDEFINQLWEDNDLSSRRAVMRMYRAAPPTGFERLRDTFRELDRPALVLWGGTDPFVPVEQAYKQLESFPSAQVVVLEQVGHWCWIEDDEGAARHVVPFFKQQFAPQPVTS